MIVHVYELEINIDKTSRNGYEQVLKKCEPLINKIAKSIKHPTLEFEDKIQEVKIMAINGIDAYNPEKGTSLSTFLHYHLTNKSKSFARSLYATKKGFGKEESYDGWSEKKWDQEQPRAFNQELVDYGFIDQVIDCFGIHAKGLSMLVYEDLEYNEISNKNGKGRNQFAQALATRRHDKEFMSRLTKKIKKISSPV